VDLTDSGGTPQTLYRARHEVFMEFAYVYWSGDEDVVGFLACGTDVIRFAYDLKQRKMIPFGGIEPDLKKDLFRQYRLPAGVRDVRLDPPFSPCSVNGWVEEFQRRFPHATSDSW
jgi:hypothetical protein